MKKITYFTSSRAEYGTMRLLLKNINSHPDFKLNLIVAGTHLSNKHGYTITEIKKDKFEILAEVDILEDEIDEYSADNDSVNDHSVNDTFMAKAFGRCVIGVAEVLSKNRPDFFLIQGDRSEALAAAIAASHLNIPIVHLSGGDITLGGTIDDRIRPAISDFAHLHFPSTRKGAEVLIKRGEEPWRVHSFGNPGINLNRELFTPREELALKLGVNLAQDLIVVVQHPVEPEQAGFQMEETLTAITELGLLSIIIYPNSDTGSQDIIKVIHRYNGPLIKSYQTLSRADFVGLLREAKVLIGNSSCGIAEAPSLSLPVVNIGERQSGRPMMTNIINVDHNRYQIKEAIQRALNLKSEIQLKDIPYYGENTEQEIIKVLLETEINKTLIKKGMIL